MKKRTQIGKRMLHMAGALMPLALFGCGEPSEIAGTDVSAPPAARIGNVATARLVAVGEGHVSGEATFAQLDESLQVEISASGLADGEYLVALRDDDVCADATGGSEASHAGGVQGDLGELSADARGMAHVKRQFPDRSLIGDPGVVSRSIVLYREDGTDDGTVAAQASVESISEEPVACGVIEWGTNSLADNR